MKVTKSATLEIDVWTWLGEKAHASDSTIDSIINRILLKIMEEEKLSNYIIIECKKCGTKYSSRLSSCPSCEAVEIFNRQTEADEAVRKDGQFQKELALKEAEIKKTQEQFQKDREFRRELIEKHGEAEGDRLFSEELKKRIEG